MDISIVIPLYNEEESLIELYDWIVKVMHDNKLSYEIILIDDGSKDGSWSKIVEISQKDKAAKGLRFRRNHGKSAALNCGFEAAQGDVVITIDADLQDSPEEIPLLFKMIKEEKYNLVSGWKKKRRDPIAKTLPSRFFNLITRMATGIPLHDFNCGLKAYQREVVKNIEVSGEMHRYIPVIAKWSGYSSIGEKEVQHYQRKYGTSKFGMIRFINGFLDLLSIMFLSRFGKRPMHLFGTIGTLMFLIGFFASAWIGFEKLDAMNKGFQVGLITQNPWFFIALTTMILGTQLFLAGFLAEMLSRHSPSRNQYIIQSKTNLP